MMLILELGEALTEIGVITKGGVKVHEASWRQGGNHIVKTMILLVV